jgi:hypothetical protein
MSLPFSKKCREVVDFAAFFCGAEGKNRHCPMAIKVQHCYSERPYQKRNTP